MKKALPAVLVLLAAAIVVAYLWLQKQAGYPTTTVPNPFAPKSPYVLPDLAAAFGSSTATKGSLPPTATTSTPPATGASTPAPGSGGGVSTYETTGYGVGINTRDYPTEV